MSYFMLPRQLGAEPTTCHGGMKQTVNGVARCIYPCKPGDKPESGCYHPTCEENSFWDYDHGSCVQVSLPIDPARCPGGTVRDPSSGKCVPICGPDQVPHALPDGTPSCYATEPNPCPPGTERGMDPHTCVPLQPLPTQTPAWVYWARVGGVLAGVGVLVGLAWYSTRGSKSAMRANHAPPGWAGSKRAPSRDDWVVVWLFENGTSSEGRFERYVSQDEIVAWSRPLLKSGLVSIMLTRPKDRSVVWSWKAPPGLV